MAGNLFGSARRPMPTTSGRLRCLLTRAGDAFDVLLVGYAGRFARSLGAHVDARAARAVLLDAQSAGPPPTFLMVRVNGHSYPAATYDGIVPTVLGHIAANATVRASVVGLLQERSEVVDSLALARIGKGTVALADRALLRADRLRTARGSLRHGSESEHAPGPDHALATLSRSSPKDGYLHAVPGERTWAGRSEANLVGRCLRIQPDRREDIHEPSGARKGFWPEEPALTHAIGHQEHVRWFSRWQKRDLFAKSLTQVRPALAPCLVRDPPSIMQLSEDDVREATHGALSQPSDPKEQTVGESAWRGRLELVDDAPNALGHIGVRGVKGLDHFLERLDKGCPPISRCHGTAYSRACVAASARICTAPGDVPPATSPMRVVAPAARTMGAIAVVGLPAVARLATDARV